MECREALELLNDEIDGRLAPADAARLAAHVAACAGCARAKAELASLRAAFRAVPKDAAPADFRAGVMASLPRGSVRSLPRTLGWIVAAAAVFVVAVTLIPNDRKVAERQVAGAPARGAAERHAAGSDAPPPEIAAPPAASAAPPSPGFAAGRDRADHDKSAVPPDSREGRTADEEADEPSGAKKADEALLPSKEEAATRRADEATAADVRYVVFRDAASAAKFAESLAAIEAEATKYKAPEAARAPAEDTRAPSDPPPPPASGGGGGAPGGGTELTAKRASRPAEEARRADLWKEGAFTSRRVVSRTPLPNGVADADLAARVAAAGGAIVPAADAPKFAELLDSAAPPQDAGATAQSAPAEKADGDAAKDRSATSADVRKKTARAPVVLVIVVLEPPAGGKK